MLKARQLLGGCQQETVQLVQAVAEQVCRRSRSEEHTSELQSLMRNSYAVFCLKKKTALREHATLEALATTSKPDRISDDTHANIDRKRTRLNLHHSH